MWCKIGTPENPILFFDMGNPSVSKGWVKAGLRLQMQHRNLWFCMLWMGFIKRKETCVCPWWALKRRQDVRRVSERQRVFCSGTEVSHSAAATLWLLLESPHTLTARFTQRSQVKLLWNKPQMCLSVPFCLSTTCWRNVLSFHLFLEHVQNVDAAVF